MNRICCFCLFLLCCIPLRLLAQGNLTADNRRLMELTEDSLMATADSMYATPLPDDRYAYSERFARQLVRALKVPNSYAYSFTKLQEKVSVLQPDDKSWRMFNWNIAPTDLTRRYYGAIQMPAEQLKLYGLSDVSGTVTKGAEDSVFSGGHWMGALYYRVMPVTVNGETVYTLFGVNGTQTSSNRKMLDALRITPEGPVFGANIFGIGSENFRGQPVKRFILEYNKEVQVGMNWNEELRAITHDNLTSATNDPSRKYTYVPSGQTDGFRWDESTGMWRHIMDILPVQILQDGQAPNGAVGGQ